MVMDMPLDAPLSSGKYMVSFDLKAEENAKPSYLGLYEDATGSDETRWNTIGYRGGKVGRYQGKNNWVLSADSKACEHNRWYHFMVWIDLDSNTMECYIDNEYYGKMGAPNSIYGLSFIAEALEETALTSIDNWAFFRTTREGVLKLHNAGINVPQSELYAVQSTISSEYQGNIFRGLDAILTVEHTNKIADKVEYSAEYSALDYRGDVVWTETRDNLTLDGYASFKDTVTPDLEAYGIFTFRSVLIPKDTSIEPSKTEVEFSLIHTATPGYRKENIGINYAETEGHWDTIEYSVDLLGVGSVRFDYKWQKFEETVGNYGYNETRHHRLERAIDMGIEPLIIFGSDHKLYGAAYKRGAITEEQLEGYNKALTELVKTYGDKVCYQLGNEENEGYEGTPGILEKDTVKEQSIRHSMAYKTIKGIAPNTDMLESGNSELSTGDALPGNMIPIRYFTAGEGRVHSTDRDGSTAFTAHNGSNDYPIRVYHKFDEVARGGKLYISFDMFYEANTRKDQVAIVTFDGRGRTDTSDHPGVIKGLDPVYAHTVMSLNYTDSYFAKGATGALCATTIAENSYESTAVTLDETLTNYDGWHKYNAVMDLDSGYMKLYVDGVEKTTGDGVSIGAGAAAGTANGRSKSVKGVGIIIPGNSGYAEQELASQTIIDNLYINHQTSGVDTPHIYIENGTGNGSGNEITLNITEPIVAADGTAITAANITSYIKLTQLSNLVDRTANYVKTPSKTTWGGYKFTIAGDQWTAGNNKLGFVEGVKGAVTGKSLTETVAVTLTDGNGTTATVEGSEPGRIYIGAQGSGAGENWLMLEFEQLVAADGTAITAANMKDYITFIRTTDAANRKDYISQIKMYAGGIYAFDFATSDWNTGTVELKFVDGVKGAASGLPIEDVVSVVLNKGPHTASIKETETVKVNNIRFLEKYSPAEAEGVDSGNKLKADWVPVIDDSFTAEEYSRKDFIVAVDGVNEKSEKQKILLIAATYDNSGVLTDVVDMQEVEVDANAKFRTYLGGDGFDKEKFDSRVKVFAWSSDGTIKPLTSEFLNYQTWITE